jgi:hypothetical protein
MANVKTTGGQELPESVTINAAPVPVGVTKPAFV